MTIVAAGIVTMLIKVKILIIKILLKILRILLLQMQMNIAPYRQLRLFLCIKSLWMM